MSSANPNEASIFNIARKIDSAADRDVYLTETCQGDAALRDRIDKLLSAFAAESQFLEQPAPGLGATIHSDSSNQDRGSALEAGLAAAFTVDEAIMLGSGNHSVLKMLGQTLPNVPRVALRESAGEGAVPITRPKSSEMPERHSEWGFSTRRTAPHFTMRSDCGPRMVSSSPMDWKFTRSSFPSTLVQVII